MTKLTRVEVHGDELWIIDDNGKRYRGVATNWNQWAFTPISLSDTDVDPTPDPTPDPGGGSGSDGTGWQWPFQYSTHVFQTGQYAALAQYGMRLNPYTHKYTMHWGLDFGAGGVAGQPIPAASGGVVAEAAYNGAMGNHVFIDHPGNMRTRYFHMVAAPAVQTGQSVTKGQILGNVGSTGNSTGPHLHWETYENGVAFNPREFMKRRGVPES